ncbi:MAG TPA: UDP-3-O-(3-hydroxymyristoyl)glucosamine N-acyltransferase [Firmicutes bacterium]|nr:UDP-3-O-(3-hydroxymyristoyl)glucosamine N-acyltransferase [Bacillota bacterium]
MGEGENLDIKVEPGAGAAPDAGVGPGAAVGAGARVRVKDLARLVGGELIGDPGGFDIEIAGAGSTEGVGEGQVTFAVDAKHLQAALKSRAACVITSPAALSSLSSLPSPSTLPSPAPRASRGGTPAASPTQQGSTKPVILVKNPRLAFARVLEVFAPEFEPPAGIHPTSVIGEGVVTGTGVSIGPFVVVERGAKIGNRVVLYPGVYIGHEAEIGDGTRIYANAVIRERVKIGRNVVIHPGAVIGGDGFGFVQDDEGAHHKIPQIGTVIIEDEVEIGSNACVDRATTDATIIRRGTKIDNLVQIAHNCLIGRNVIIAGQAGIAGSAILEDGVVLGGQVGVVDHVRIGQGTIIGGMSGVTGSIPPGCFYSGNPARPHQEDLAIEVARRRLPELMKTVKNLEARIKELENLLNPGTRPRE